MRQYLKFYIDGQWVESAGTRTWDVINPATEEVAGQIALGAKEDVSRAVAAARRAFSSWSRTSREERIAMLGHIAEIYKTRLDDMCAAISEEMGAPEWVAREAQAPAPLAHLKI